MASRRHHEVDRQVAALLKQKLSSGADAADIEAYLRFADQNWHHYVATVATYLDLHAFIRDIYATHYKIMLQELMTPSVFENAFAVLRVFQPY